MKIVDFHSHILPGIDDGSKDVQMSLAMLEKMKAYGTDTVCATSHYYARHRSIDSFLERRAKAFEALQSEIETNAPHLNDIEIRCGAEVAFYSGIAKEQNIERLCIEGTNTLLLEMPFTEWSDFEINTVADLCFNNRINVVIAHIERYYGFTSEMMIDQLMDLPVYVQINAESIIPMFGRKKWLEMFRQQRAHLLGSDAHNLTDRVPNLGAARDIIKKKLGAEALDEIDLCATKLLTT